MELHGNATFIVSTAANAHHGLPEFTETKYVAVSW